MGEKKRKEKPTPLRKVVKTGFPEGYGLPSAAATAELAPNSPMRALTPVSQFAMGQEGKVAHLIACKLQEVYFSGRFLGRKTYSQTHQ